MIPYCQYDYRRTIYVIELTASFIKDKKNYTTNDIIHFIKSLGTKDIDIGLYEGVESVFNDNTLEYEDLLNIYHTDTNSVPFLIHENFINYVDKNSNNSYTQKLDVCIEYYDNLINSCADINLLITVKFFIFFK